MKNVEAMSIADIFHWLDKTRASVRKAMQRGVSHTSHRAYELKDRYEDLRSVAIRRGVWNRYCIHHGLSNSHDAYDLWA